MKIRTIVLASAFLVSACVQTDTNSAPDSTGSDPVIISVLGTSDVHGELLPQSDRGGLVTFSGYVAALRDVREDDGAVLLVDAGDMWQGTLESNLTEGATVVSAYNALGYAAAAIGNHEFDFGPAGPKAIPQHPGDDPQGALRQRATETDFPLLAANLVDERNNRPVDWKNVKPSTIVTREGVEIGIIGVTTEEALITSIAANTVGLNVTPLADPIIREARKLREEGAALVVVVAHAGSHCEKFDDPDDLSSCNTAGEIMQVARAIPAGLVDHIVAGHTHRGVAHVVNGISINSAYSRTYAFSRTDFTIDRSSGKVTDRRIFPPRGVCARTPDERGFCVSEEDESASRATYEDRVVEPMAELVAIAAKARERTVQLQAEKVGVNLETPMTLTGRPESALGNLMTDAVLQSNDADISIHNVAGGIRAPLPQGELTYGSVFRMFPFDNRIAVLELTGHEVRKIIANQVHNVGRRAGFSGMRVFVGCNDEHMSIRMVKADGAEIADTDTLRVVANDFLLMGGDKILTPVIPEQGFEIPQGTPLVRDTLVEWFRARGGRMSEDDFLDADEPRWNLPEPLPAGCFYSGG